MPISNQIPSSRLIQPGVIDNTAARPASPFEGQVVFQKDTDQLLVWNGTAWVVPNSPAQNPTGLEFIRHDTIAAGTTTYSWNNCFNSTYENYKVIITNCTPVTSGAQLRFRWRNAGVDRVQALYQSQWNGRSAASSNYDSNVTNTDYGFFGISPNFNGGHVNPATLEMYSPNVAIRSMLNFHSSTYLGAFVSMVGSIAYDGERTGNDGFTLFMSSGTFSATVSVYGYRK